MHRLRPPVEEKPDTPKMLDETHVALRKMLLSKQIKEEVYAKNIVAIALRWIILGRIEDANAMICELTTEYLTEDLPRQMLEDDDFRVVAHQVAETLGSMPMDLDEDDAELAPMLIGRPDAKA
jgi:hypothetical protein